MSENWDAYEFMEKHLDYPASVLIEIAGNAEMRGGKLHKLFVEMPDGAIIVQLALNENGFKLNQERSQQVYSSYQSRKS